MDIDFLHHINRVTTTGTILVVTGILVAMGVLVMASVIEAATNLQGIIAAGIIHGK